MQAEAQGDMPPFSVPNRKRRGLTILLIGLVLIGSGALFFRQQPNSATTRPLPTTLHWQEALRHSFVESLVAAPSNPAVLYACALPSSLLRSTDAGLHWQPLPGLFGTILACSIAVNPVQANDLFISSARLATPDSATLQRSRDGGQTWTTIQATLITPDGQKLAWAGSRLSFVGDHLFALQTIHHTFHVIASADGGHLWRVIDTPITNAHQGARAYVVDPTTPTTLYALVGAMVLAYFSSAPSGATPPPMPTPLPANQLMSHLYKTTNGGKSWQEVLSSVPYGSSLRLASANPHLLYVGGLTGMVSASSSGTFHMQWSADGGASWQPVAVPVHVPLLNNWVVDASGFLYDTVYDPGSSHAPRGSMERYDPWTHQWSTLALPSPFGTLLAVTSTASTTSDVFWCASLDMALYRGTLSFR